MITDVPTTEEYRANGLAFLHLAWDSIVEMVEILDDTEEYMVEHEEATDEEIAAHANTYWLGLQTELAVAFALTQQGAEFLLKSKIVSVSPFLLISDLPSQHKKDAANQSFGGFKTVDAADLVSIHDAVCSTKLPGEFIDLFSRLRLLRNTIMHSLVNTPLLPRDALLKILKIVHHLVGEKQWQSLQIEHFKRKTQNSRSNFNLWYGHTTRTLLVIDSMLEPAEAKFFFEFDPKQHRYICYNCYEGETHSHVKSCILKPKSPTATEIHCVGCQAIVKVKREDCPHEPCPGNVIGPGWLEEEDGELSCLTCGESIEKEETDK